MESTSRPPGPPTKQWYAFGPFVLDPIKRVLWRDGRTVAMTAKTFDVLHVLIEHRARIVGKDELLNRIWPDTAVQENNLVRQISTLRRALDQRPDQHDYVVTIPGQGYRFVANVEQIPAVAFEAGSQRREPSTEPTAEMAGLDERSAAPARNDLITSRSSFPLWLPHTATWVIAASIVLVGIAALLLIRPDRPASDPRRALQRITYDEVALPREAAWSPDGEWVAYTSDRSGNADLWKQRVGDPNPIQLTASEANDWQPHWSPDGRSIVFRSERDGGGLFVIDASGGTERRIASFGYEPRWSRDGTRVLFKRSNVLPGLPNIYVGSVDGKPPRPVNPDFLSRFDSLEAAWHPDGQRVSIWGTNGAKERTFLTVTPDDDAAVVAEISDEVRRNLGELRPGRFVWAPSRRHVYFEARAGDTQNVWRVTVDPQTERWVGGPERLTTGAGEETNVALSPDGTSLLFTTRSSRTRLWAFPFNPINGLITGEPRPITQGNTGEVDFDARADGSKVAYRTVRAGRHELWERSIVEGRERLLLSSAVWRYTKPRWSPDGERLAYSRRPTADNSAAAVAVLNADGSGDRALTRPGDVEMSAYDWSQRGDAILGACRFSPAERYSTCVVPVSAANQVVASGVRVIASDPKRNLFNPRFSPDQRWISFLAHDLKYVATSTVYVIPAAGGKWTAITEGTWFDDKPHWAPDGRALYFVSNRTGVPNVWGRRFDPSTGAPAGEPFQVTAFRSAQFMLTPRTVQMDIAVTSTHLLLPISEARGEIWKLDRVDR